MNRMLIKNEGKNGSYTIKVRDGYAIPNKPLDEVMAELFKEVKSQRAAKKKRSAKTR